MWTLRLIASLTLLLGMTGCATGHIQKADQRSVCDGWKPILPTPHDWRIMSDGTARAIDAHDNYGAKEGCWEKR